jgi:hypothetical protein
VFVKPFTDGSNLDSEQEELVSSKSSWVTTEDPENPLLLVSEWHGRGTMRKEQKKEFEQKVAEETKAEMSLSFAEDRLL